MPSAIDTLTHSLAASKELVISFCQDLKPEEYLHRPTADANCVAWLLGHLAVSDRKVMSIAMGVTDLPPMPQGCEPRFGRDAATARAADFGDVSILLPLFTQTRDLLIAKVQSCDEAELGQPLAVSHPRFKTRFEAINFMGLHAAMHAGQMSTIRRSLGRPPVM